MKLLPICSSSKGNSVFIGGRSGGVAIDVGCSFRAFRSGLSAAGIDLSAVKAILITHSHTDHVKGLLTLTKNVRIPIYASEETIDCLLRESLVDTSSELRPLTELKSAEFDADIKWFPTPHDCEGSVGYTFGLSDRKLGFATDLGHVTDRVRESLTGCRTVFIEANYQPEILKSNTRYPVYLKQRIASDHGHLSNPDSAAFCASLAQSGTLNFMLGHLSQENNTPEIAFGAVRKAIEDSGGKYERDFTLSVAQVSNDEGKYIVV